MLIPATRGGRDAVYDGRSMQGFSTAMRVLSRRATPVGGRYIMMPTEAVTKPAGPSRRVLERRRQVLRRLLAAAGLTLVAAVALGGPWPFLHVAADGLLVAYVVRLRRVAVAAQAARRAARLAELRTRQAEHRAAYEAASRGPAMPERPLVREVRLPAQREPAQRLAAGE